MSAVGMTHEDLGALVGRLSAVTTARAAVGGGVLAFMAYWVATAMMRWEHLQIGAFDFAFFDQIVWNTSQGRFFSTTFTPYNFLGQHVEPVLLLFAAMTRVGAGPLSLLVVQAVVCGIAAVPLFEAARALRLPTPVAAAAALAYLANPYLHRALAFDFHPETMIVLPAFGAVWAFATGRSRLGAACALSVLLFKEDAAFVLLALAVVAWTLGVRRPAAFLAVSAVAWAVLTVFVLMPLVRHGQPSDLVERYGTLLGGYEGIEGSIWLATHPLTAMATLATPERAASIGTFIAANGPWLLLAPLQVLTLLPGFALALLSSHPQQQQLAFHYAAELVPVAAIAGLFGARRLLLLVPSSIVAASMLLVAMLALPLAGPRSEFASDSVPTEAHRSAVARATALVPSDAAVSAQSNLAPRLARRREIWEFPGQWADADWVLVDRYGFRSSQSIDAGFDAAFSDVRGRYRLMFEEDGVSVYQAVAR